MDSSQGLDQALSGPLHVLVKSALRAASGKLSGIRQITAPIAKGDRMPPYAGNAVTWQLIQYA